MSKSKAYHKLLRLSKSRRFMSSKINQDIMRKILGPKLTLEEINKGAPINDPVVKAKMAENKAKMDKLKYMDKVYGPTGHGVVLNEPLIVRIERLEQEINKFIESTRIVRIERLELDVERLTANIFELVSGNSRLTDLFTNSLSTNPPASVIIGKSLDSALKGVNIEKSLVKPSLKSDSAIGGKSLDSAIGKSVNGPFIPGLLDEFTDLKNSSPSELENSYNELKRIYDILCSIGAKEGFINSLDFTDERLYPLISSKIPHLLDYEYKIPKQANESQRNEYIKERQADPVGFYKSTVAPN
jgi:hypothetical protein